MDDNKLLELLRQLEWSGANDTETEYACLSCGLLKRDGTHRANCVIALAIGYVQQKCEKQAAWDLLAKDFGPGQVIALPTEPRVWGAWGGKEWLLLLDGKILTQPSERLMKANLLGINPGYEAREIGIDGLPVPTENET